MICKACQLEVPDSAVICPHCQAPLIPLSEPVDATSADNPYSAPLAEYSPPPATLHGEGDSTGGLIPYKNPKALLAYYLGIVSGLPLIGFPIAIAAFVFGILGLRDRKRNPVIKGSVHAWIGIGCGGLFTLLWGLMILALLVSLATNI